ncbi:MAG TPA: DEAD/DEAH box helicase, partial [Acidimicrobiia bacterium]|nr:DEAD/DEAH box helicase [Acidimicrobiia bacterium]
DLGLPRAVVEGALADLEGRGRVVRGALRPGGHEMEWVSVDVLQRMRRRSLALLRRQIEAVGPDALVRFSHSWHGVGGGGSGPARMRETLERLQGAALPASILESDVLPARLDYSPDLLDSLTASGDVVWVGRGALGGRDGRVALYLRDRVAELMWDLGVDRPADVVHDRIRNHLGQRGASFFRDLYDAAGGGDPEVILAALWDLVWAGEVTNDTIAPLRAYLWGRVRKTPGRRPILPGSTAPPAGSGRWYLTRDLLAAVTPEAVVAARTQQLLSRHGILVRDAVLAEGVPGGFAGVYPVLSAMEDVGRVRRGYFVEGLGGSQFALPGAVERLRLDPGAEGAVVLAAADPANPYGAAIPWPEQSRQSTVVSRQPENPDRGSDRKNPQRAARSAGAYVVTVAGTLTAFVDRGGRAVHSYTNDPDTIATTAVAITDLARTRLRRMVVASIDGADPATTPLGRALLAAGFAVSYRGLAARS